MTNQPFRHKGTDFREAIENHCEGRDSKLFYDVVDELKNGKIRGNVLANFLRCLSDNIVVIGKRRCHELINAVLYLDWIHEDLFVIAQYKCFLLHFVTAHANYLRTVLLSIIKNCFANNKANMDDEASVHVHEVIKNISTLVPMATTHLIPVISECFPYFRKNSQIQEIYVKNVLAIATFLPQKRRDILESIINQLIQLDVYTPKQTILDTDFNSDSGNHLQKVTFAVEAKDPSIFGDTEHTLDILMETVFKFMESICFCQEELVWDSTKILYEEFLTIFNNRILPTHACGHVQFLLFYLCSLNVSLCENTIDFLWKKTQNHNIPTILRQMSVLYLSGLLARAKFVPVNLVISCLDALCTWTHKYIDTHNESLVFVDSNLHGVFYGVCQAVFYIIIYRHGELLDLPKGFFYLRTMCLDRIITCCLNPLRMCHPIVVRKFAAIVSVNQIAYCQTVLQKNQRIDLPTAQVCIVNNLLESFFPFDPYVLKRSKRFISSSYREYEAAVAETIIPDGEEDDFLHDDIEQLVEFSLTTAENIISSSPGFK